VIRYHHVDAMKAEGFPVAASCEVAEVSTSAYYEWRDRQAAGPSEAAVVEADLVERIRTVHTDSDGTYGAPRVTAELARRGYCANHKRIERLMALHGIAGVTARRKDRTTVPAKDAPPLPAAPRPRREGLRAGRAEPALLRRHHLFGPLTVMCSTAAWSEETAGPGWTVTVSRSSRSCT
jgi:transposase InsO family protein